MTPKTKFERDNRVINDYRAVLLEGVASYVEQLEVAEGDLALVLQAKIVRDVREAK